MSEDPIGKIEKESSPNLSIPDFYWKGVQDNLNVDVEGTFADIEVDVNIPHPYIGDLIVSLTAPSGKSIYLHYREEGSKENLIHTYDLGNTPSLKNFVGENIKGEWTLSVSDRGWRDVGTLKSWGFRLKKKEILAKAKWTLLAYIIGDDKPSGGFSLDPFGLTDIKEMKRVGSTEQLRILVHRDRWEEPGCWRFDIGGPEGDMTDDIVESLPETNAGDPNTLLEFVEWGVERAPAEHYLLVLWNHGSGWYVPEMMRRASMAGLTRFSSRAEERNVGKMQLRKAIFTTTLDTIFSIRDAEVRGICYDDTSSDCLDNEELEKVLSQCAQIMGKPKIDLVGMDACLMNMIEVAYQIRHNSSILVGSEESEPANGWPYDLVLTKLRNEPEISPEEFSKHIVRAYAESYSGDDVTQSAIDLSKLDNLTKAVDTLAKALLELLEDDEQSKYKIADVRQAVTDFWGTSPGTGLYVDLYDLAELFSTQNLSENVTNAANEVVEAMSNPKKTPIIDEINEGWNMRNTHGLSIHFPANGDDSPYYKQLYFCHDTKWPDFLLEYKKARTIRRP